MLSIAYTNRVENSTGSIITNGSSSSYLDSLADVWVVKEWLFCDFLLIGFMVEFLLKGKEKHHLNIATRDLSHYKTADKISNSFVLKHDSCLQSDVDLHILWSHLHSLLTDKLRQIVQNMYKL